MLTYFYRSIDRFNVDVEALVIYTDSNKNYRPSFYEYKGVKTKLRYDFNTYKLTDFTEADYEGMQNPFAIIFQTALIGMKRNLKDEELLELKVTLYRKLLKKGYVREQITKIGTFIRDLIRFKKKEFNRIFVE